MSAARRPWSIVSPLVAATLLGTLVGCGTDSGSGPGSVVPTVVTGAYPFAFVAEQVGGEAVDVVNLTPPGVEPHDIEISPQQTVEVADADVIVTMPGFQPAFDDVVTQSGGDAAVVDVSNVVTIAGADPHVWLDPTNLIPIAEAVADQLAAVNPAAADTYDANAADFIQRVTELDRDFADTLATCRQDAFVTNHAAFGYLADRYGLTQIAISGLDPEAEATPSQLAQVADAVGAAGVTTVFTETLVSPATAETLAEELGLTVDTLDPVEGITDPMTSDYFSVMRQNLAALAAANECS